MTSASDYSDVFISYRRTDVEFVKYLADELRKRGKEIWIDWEDIPPGSVGFTDDIKRGLDGADTFICVLSPEYLQSSYCVDLELGYAVKNNKRIIPVVLKKVDGFPIPGGISHINWIYFTPHAGQENKFTESFPRIIEAMETDIEHVRKHKNVLLRALEWDKNTRAPSFLLGGDELTSAEAWLVNAAGKEPIPTDLHKSFVSASRETENRRRRLLLSGVITALVVTAVLAIVAIFFGVDASRQRTIAETARDQAQELAAQVQALFLADTAAAQQQGDPVLALALIQRAIEQLEVPTLGLQRAYARLVYEPGPTTPVSVDAGQITELLGSPNQRYVVTGTCENSGETCDNPHLLVWDTSTWEVVHDLDWVDGRITALAISENSDHLAAAMCAVASDSAQCEQGVQIATYNLTDGTPLQRWSGASLRIETLAFSHNGRLLATGGVDASLVVRDAQTLDPVLNLVGHEGQVSGVAFTGNDAQIFSTGCRVTCDAGDLFQWDAREGEAIARFEDIAAGTSPIVIADTRNQALFGDSRGVLIVWDINAAQIRHVFAENPDTISFLWLNADESRLVTSSGTHHLTIWEALPGGLLAVANTFAVADEDITGAALYNNGQQIVSGLSSDPVLMLWDTVNGAIVNNFDNLTVGVQSVAVSPDNVRAAAATTEGDILAVTLATGEIWRQWDTDQSIISDIAYTPDGRFIATAECNNANCTAGRIRFRNSDDGSVWKDFVGHGSRVARIAISADGENLISFAEDNTVFVWDVANGNWVHNPTFADAIVKQVGFIDNGDTFMVTTNQAVTLWSMEDGSQSGSINAPDAPFVNAVASLNNAQIATADEDGHITLWDRATGTLSSRTLVTDTPTPLLAAAANSFFVGDRDMLSVLDNNGNIVREYRNTRRVFDVAPLADGSQVLVAEENGLTLWRIDTFEELLAWAQDNRYITELSCEEASNYLIETNCDDTVISE
jgi:WD40 repeat protein